MTFTPTIESSPEYKENPRRGRGEKGWLLQAIEKLEHGQSFFVPLSEVSSEGYLRVRLNVISKSLGIRLSGRKETNQSVAGIRVYRLDR